jgi:hypothetical protein
VNRLTTGETLVLAAALGAGALLGCVALAIVPVLLDGAQPFTLLAVAVGCAIGVAAASAATGAAFIPVHPLWRVAMAAIFAGAVAYGVELSLLNTASGHPAAVVTISSAAGGCVALLAIRRRRQRAIGYGPV